MRITSRALAFVSRWFDASTVDRVFAPLIADWQREWHDASGMRRWSVWMRGLCAFLCAVLLSSPVVLRQPIPAAVSNRIVTRVARFTLLATVLISLPFASNYSSIGLLVLFIVPSNLVLAYPFAMIAAVDAIRRDHPLRPHVERAAAVKLVTASLVFMVIFGGFVVPASNQAFREASARQLLRAAGVERSRIALLDDGREYPPRGLRERTTYELMTGHGFTDGSRYLRETVNRELNNRASIAALPALLLWLRWRMLDLPRRRWSTLPASAIAVAAFVGIYVLRQAGVWAPAVVAVILMGLGSTWRTWKVHA